MYQVNEIKRVLLKPFYNALLWDQVHNFIVRTKLQPFEFTANGLYSINYSLFGSVSRTNAQIPPGGSIYFLLLFTDSGRLRHIHRDNASV